MNKKQFIDAYQAFYPQGKADKFCGHVFKVFDSDNSGQIDFTEFLIAISVSAQGDASKKISLAFKMFKIFIKRNIFKILILEFFSFKV